MDGGLSQRTGELVQQGRGWQRDLGRAIKYITHRWRMVFDDRKGKIKDY